MTTPNSDPQAINFDDFELEVDPTTASKPTETPLNLDKFDTDPFNELSFDELLELDDTANNPTLAGQSQHQTQSAIAFNTSDTPIHIGNVANNLPNDSDLVSPATQPLAIDIDNELSELTDSGSQPTPINTPETSAITPVTKDTSALLSPEPLSFDKPEMSHPSDNLTAPSLAAGAAMIGGVALASQSKPETASPVTPLSSDTPTPKKSLGLDKGLFNKKPKQTVPPATPTLPKINGKTNPPPKKNNLLPLIILGAIAALAAGYWFMTQSEPTPTPATPVAKKTTTAPVASVTPAAPVVTASTPVATVTTITNSSVAPTPTVATTNSATAATPTLNTTNVIKPEDITAPALPADNTTAKEEIDRLGQQSQQLAEQEKMMEEQLKMMNELSSKKEERIAILEKQIAQLEAQKGQAK